MLFFKKLRAWVFLLFCVAGVLYPSSAQARGRARSFWALEAGGFGSNLIQRYSVQSENASLVSTIAGYARLRYGGSVSRKWLIEPSLGVVVPWRTGPDGSPLTFNVQFNTNIGWLWTSWLKFNFGPGIHWMFTVSSENEVILNNGNSTSSFFSPGGTSSVFAFTVQGGFEFLLSRKFSLSLDVYFLNVASSLRRRMNGTILLGYRL